MAIDGSRPGGRSARIQRAVHDAVLRLERERGREALTVPVVAGAAGVAVTTIYRRWGDLDTLLADVAAERFREAPMPEETGTLLGDVRAWALQFLEETDSEPGRASLLDLLRVDLSAGLASACSGRARMTLHQIAARHGAQDDFDVEKALDRIAAPILFRILFVAEAVDADFAASLVDELFAESVVTQPRLR